MALSIYRRCLWEAVGTALLVYIGCGSMLSSGEVAAISLAFGGIVALVVITIGPRSGAHINPAVTVGFAFAGQFPWREVPAYIGSQLVGAAIGFACLIGSFTSHVGDASQANGAVITIAELVEEIGLATGTYPAGNARDTAAPTLAGMPQATGAFVAELVHTAILMGMILAIVNDAKEEGGKCALVVGGTVLVLCAAGGAAQASMNPARTIWCNVAAGRFDTLWIYIVAPVAGAVLVSIASRFLTASSATPEATPRD